MRICNRLATTLVTAGLLLGPPLGARTKNGDKYINEGLRAEQVKDYDKALEFFRQALSEDPNDADYRISFLRCRYRAAQAHVDAGEKLQSQGEFEKAVVEFEKALAIDPSITAALQALGRIRDLTERAKKGPLTEAEELERQGLTPAEVARQSTERRREAVLPAPELKPLSAAPITLKINNQPPKVVFETIGKLAGINVLFDPDYTTQGQVRNVSLDLNNATLEQALDYAAIMTRSFWKPISQNAVFVTTDVQNKRAEYEDQVAKVFYLSNVTVQTELTEIISSIRAVANIQRIMPFNSQNAIIMKGSADQVALAELLIHDLDRPRPEVVVDVVVMEASRTRSRDLGITPVSGGAAGISIPVAFTPSVAAQLPSDGNGGGSGGQSSSINLSRLGKLSSKDFSITLPGAILQALMSDSGTKVLQSPQVRTMDNAKASLKIGERVPYSTGGFQPAFGQVGTGFNSLYSSFQFLDVGVNVDITPKVHNSDEVSMHIELDISNVRGRVDIGGISQPIVGQRKVVHDIRLREGEVSLLGGLVQDQERKSVSGVPGLSSIPVIRRLFTTETVEKDESELLIAIIPHIVRTPDFTQANFKGIAVGTERVTKLSFAPQKPEGPPPVEAPKPTPAPVVLPPVAPPEAPKPAPVGPPAPAAPASVAFSPASVEAQAGAIITVSLQVENVSDLFSAPLKIKFDPNTLRLNEVTRGELLARDGRQVIFTRNILNDIGDATVNLNRMPGAGGISGSGTLVTLTFQAVRPGTSTVSAPDLALRDSQSQTVLTASPQVTVNIK